jgi:protein tyrosine kinase modulator
MRDQASIKRFSGQNQATLMTIAFEATSPAVAAQVTNAFVTLILQENVQFRTDRAGETLDFFEQEVERLGGELDRQSSEILAFKNKNSDALPDGLNYRLDRQSSLLERMAQIQRERSSITDQRIRLIQIFNATGSVQLPSGQPKTPAQQQLAKVREDLSQALLVYSEENPRVKILQARLAQLEEVVRTEAPAENTAGPNTSLLDVQLSEIDSRIQSMVEQTAQITAELAELKSAIDRTPANAITLEALERDYANVRSQYNAAVDRLSKAATGERIELSAKGQRITIIEQATTPTEPVRPNRPLIAGGGVLFAIFAGIGSIVLLETLNRSIRRPVDLTKNLGITPLATLPYVRTAREAVWRRFIISVASILVVVGVPGVLYFIHTNYLPLDLFFARTMNRFGL